MFKRLIALLVLCFCLPLLGLSQEDTPINVESGRVLPGFGEVEVVAYSLPIKAGMTSGQEIKRSGASALRLHFVISPPCIGPWELKVLDKDNRKIWSYTPASGLGCDIWSDLLRGDVAKVEVVGKQKVRDLTVTIDKIVVTDKVTGPKSLTVNKLSPIHRASPEIQKWGRSVARLVFVREGQGQTWCTGFLVAPDLFLTNNHCIKTNSEMSSGLAEFDYDREGATPLTLRFKEIVKTNRRLDFTLLRLRTKSDRPPFTFHTELQQNKPLVIIQHAGGGPKQVSIENCKVIGVSVAGVTRDRTDFGHGCDTISGASGSPVLDIQTGKLLGVHHFGFLPNDRPVNRAVRIEQILNFLRSPRNLRDVAARRALGFKSQ